MKKFILMMAVMFTALTMNAQVATENAKLTDNVYTTVNVGAATPLCFDAVFPLNTTVGLAVGKQFTPIWGAEVEGTAWFGSHSHGNAASRFDTYGNHNLVRGSYVGVNGTVNLTNLFCGYNGTPRLFEVSTVLGSGWIHTFTPNASDEANNRFGVKTGLDIAFNLGKTKAHTVSIRPAVLWDVTGGEKMPMEFDKRYAQLQLGVAYTYHFKTSNGTRHFKTYDVGALTTEINRLAEENAALKARKPEVVEKRVEVVKEVPTPVLGPDGIRKYIVMFEFNSAALSNAAKEELNKVHENVVVDIDAYASPEGNEQYNLGLSEQRKNVVKEYLEGRGVKVNEARFHGAADKYSNRVAIITMVGPNTDHGTGFNPHPHGEHPNGFNPHPHGDNK